MTWMLVWMAVLAVGSFYAGYVMASGSWRRGRGYPSSGRRVEDLAPPPEGAGPGGRR